MIVNADRKKRIVAILNYTRRLREPNNLRPRQDQTVGEIASDRREQVGRPVHVTAVVRPVQNQSQDAAMVLFVAEKTAPNVVGQPDQFEPLLILGDGEGLEQVFDRQSGRVRLSHRSGDTFLQGGQDRRFIFHGIAPNWCSRTLASFAAQCP